MRFSALAEVAEYCCLLDMSCRRLKITEIWCIGEWRVFHMRCPVAGVQCAVWFMGSEMGILRGSFEICSFQLFCYLDRRIDIRILQLNYATPVQEPFLPPTFSNSNKQPPTPTPKENRTSNYWPLRPDALLLNIPAIYR